MRKWMRERLQRRKKKPAETTEQAAPPPLQPAYFDAEQSPDDTPEVENVASENPPPASEPVARESAAHDSGAIGGMGSEMDEPSSERTSPSQPTTGAGSGGRGRRRRE